MVETIFAGDLSLFCTEEKLFSLVCPFGDVKSVIIRRGRQGENLQYGFIQMDHEAAREVVRAMNGMKFLGRKLR